MPVFLVFFFKLINYLFFTVLIQFSENYIYMCILCIYTIILLKSVAVPKLQVAILARSSREMSKIVRID